MYMIINMPKRAGLYTIWGTGNSSYNKSWYMLIKYSVNSALTSCDFGEFYTEANDVYLSTMELQLMIFYIRRSRMENGKIHDGIMEAQVGKQYVIQ